MHLPSSSSPHIASCQELHCGHKRKCSIKVSKPFCSLKTKICSAWGDSYYRTFDGRELVLQGNCNYTLVQTTCPGFNASVPLEIIIARAYLNRASVSAIHTVQINVQGFNITMHREERNHVRVRVRNIIQIIKTFIVLPFGFIFIVYFPVKFRLMDRRGTCLSLWEMAP